jgi:hypothetical protein
MNWRKLHFYRIRDAARRSQRSIAPQTSTLGAAMKASCGMSTLPNWRMRFLPSFCFSRSLRLQVTFSELCFHRSAPRVMQIGARMNI